MAVALPSTHSIVAREYAQAQRPTSGSYWFQVGAWAQSNYGYAHHFGIPVTGASVEIRVLSNQRLKYPDSGFAYWVGINMPNDAFIQVGYLVDRYDNRGEPSWFWEYFPPGTASEGTVGFLGKIGSVVGPNGTWIKFSITSSGSRWSAYVDQEQVGSVDLGLSSSTVGPYASAEVAQVSETDNVLGPVEFRNLEYRDNYLNWHMPNSAVALCCYSSGSDKLSEPTYPYGIASIPGENNHWLAGSHLPHKAQGDYLWPWFRVSVTSPYGEASGGGWHVYGDIVNPIAMSEIKISPTERYLLTGWNANRVPSSSMEFTVTQNLDLMPVYAHQFLVTVTSQYGKIAGSGWYNAGSKATISITPSTTSAPGLLGQLGVRSIFGHWTGDYSGSDTNPTITVDSPKSIQAVWLSNYGTLLPLLGVVFAGTAIALAVMAKNKVGFDFRRLQRAPTRSLRRMLHRKRRRRSRRHIRRSRRD